LGIDGEDLPGVTGGLGFLKRVKMESIYGDMGIGPRVAVIGGGNTAIDAARSALRLEGVKEVVVIYRRSKNEMPAHREEVEQAEAEGVKFKFLAAPVGIRPGIMENIFTCQTMKLGEPDASGRRKPVPVEGSEFEIAADTIIKAIGEEKSGVFRTGEKILIIGDASSGPASVAEAVAAGKKAARIISGESENRIVNPASFERVNPDYFSKMPKAEIVKIARAMRHDFREVNLGLSQDIVFKEASKCFSCGLCNHCDNCYSFCPDGAVIKTEAGYEINYDFCKGCLICFKECPVGAINFNKEGE
jgi:NADPH-dependent glutamate synthase beta subunit-like oxidoreductase